MHTTSDASDRREDTMYAKVQKGYAQEHDLTSSWINLTYGLLNLRRRLSISISKWQHIKRKIETLSLVSLFLAYSSQRLYVSVIRHWNTQAVLRQLKCSSQLQLRDFLAAISLSFLRNKISFPVALGINLQWTCGSNLHVLHAWI